MPELAALGLVFPSCIAAANEASGKESRTGEIVLEALPELSLRILEHAREHGRVTIGDIVKLTGTSRNTLKQHFRQLVA
jgi:hypothetical protein